MLLRRAFQYKSWADRRTLDAVAKIDARSFPAEIAFACQQLNHMVRVEELFRARLEGVVEPHDSTNTAEVPRLAELDRRLTDSNEWLHQYSQALLPGALGEEIRFTFVDGRPGMLIREELLFHMINHGTYHRGAIGHALDLAQVPRPADTYTVFIHATEPQRRTGKRAKS